MELFRSSIGVNLILLNTLFFGLSRGRNKLCINKAYVGPCENKDNQACSQSCKDESLSGGKCGPLSITTVCYCDGCPGATVTSPDPTVVKAVTTSTTSTASNTGIEWNGNWAFACDFSSNNDLSRAIVVRGEECSKLCASTPGCTHFTWNPAIYGGSYCFMKSGPVTKANAFKIDGYPNVRCGLPDAIRVLTVSGWKVRGIFMFELDASQSSQNCLERCRTIPGCVLISWQDHFGCFGYSNTTEIGLVADAAWTSMTLTGRGSPKVLPNTEYLGDDLRYSDDGPAQVQDFAVKPETVSNGELCWKLCVIHPHCNVAVLNAIDVGWMGCYLKHKEVDNPSTRANITTYRW